MCPTCQYVCLMIHSFVFTNSISQNNHKQAKSFYVGLDLHLFQHSDAHWELITNVLSAPLYRIILFFIWSTWNIICIMLMVTLCSADGSEQRGGWISEISPGKWILFLVTSKRRLKIKWTQHALPVAMLVIAPLCLTDAHLITQMVH